MHGHTKAVCNLKAKCTKCDEEHTTNKCERNALTVNKCVNCEGAHAQCTKNKACMNTQEAAIISRMAARQDISQAARKYHTDKAAAKKAPDVDTVAQNLPNAFIPTPAAARAYMQPPLPAAGRYEQPIAQSADPAQTRAQLAAQPACHNYATNRFANRSIAISNTLNCCSIYCSTGTSVNAATSSIFTPQAGYFAGKGDSSSVQQAIHCSLHATSGVYKWTFN